jgi:hypothetical protein
MLVDFSEELPGIIFKMMSKPGPTKKRKVSRADCRLNRNKRRLQLAMNMVQGCINMVRNSKLPYFKVAGNFMCNVS